MVPRKTTDAFVVVPGIMGSELLHPEHGLVWGLRPDALVRAWLTGAVDRLLVQGGDNPVRVAAPRVLQCPAWAPFLRGVLPYTRLLRHLEALGDPRAVATFPYDWRLATGAHVQDFIDCCDRHLQTWRTVVDSERLGDPEAVRLVVVAHSMGGLIARRAVLQEAGLASQVRMLVTIGTPFYGSMQAVEMLATGKGAPVPARAARDLARTCPGVYDLLPRYECVEALTGRRLLTAIDIGCIGGDARMAAAAESRWASLGLERDADKQSPVKHVAIVGGEQPTAASLSFYQGGFSTSDAVAGVEEFGDGTVWRRSAAPPNTESHIVVQTHTALPVTKQTLSVLTDKVLNRDSGPWLGTRPVGVSFPAIAVAWQPVRLVIRDVPDALGARPGDPRDLQVTCVDLVRGTSPTWPTGRSVGDRVEVVHPGLPAGLFQVSVKSGGFEPVEQIILVEDT